MATLNDIRIKVRRLTRSPSTSQITNDQLDDYINTFLLYDFPSTLRTFAFRSTFTFHTNPNVDTYKTSNVVGDEFYQFKDKYISVHQPAYISGQLLEFCQSRANFFAQYPQVQSIVQVGTGDGVVVNFVGTLQSIPVMPNNVTFTAVDANNNGMSIYDRDGDGVLYGDGFGVINYVTGIYLATFTNPPANATEVKSQTVPYEASMPRSLLYFEDEFTLRPIPDQPYEISVEVYKRPTELLNAADEPELQEHYQYIAYGAAKHIFEDRSDMESVARIMPEFKNQEELVLSRTVMQREKERPSTIYVSQFNSGPWNNRR